MGVLSGTAGAINGISHIFDWVISSSQDLAKIVASSTSGGSVRLAGNSDWQGAYVASGATPTHMPGEEFTFTGSIDGTNGATGVVLVSRVRISCPLKDGKEIIHTVEFASNGALSLGAAAATDVTKLAPLTSIGCKIKEGTVANPVVYTEVVDIEGWELEITADNAEYVSSSTAGGTRRLAGNIDFRVTVPRLLGDFADLPAVGSELALQLFVDGTTFWQLEWARVSGVSDLKVDVATREPIGATVEYEMNGVVTISGDPDVVTTGTIKNPATATWWP